MESTGTLAGSEEPRAGTAGRSSSADGFSLMKGGPFYQGLVRTRLMRSDLAPGGRRAALLAAIGWLPLLLLSAIDGAAYGPIEEGPFLLDFAATVRLLLALPLLVLAESLTERRAALVCRSFVEAGLIRKQHYAEFDVVLCRVARMRDSVVAEVVIIGGIVAVTWLLLRFEVEAPAGWEVADEGRRSAAGWWSLLVSVPIFQFLLARWFWRYFIWCWFLWRLSRMDLRLFPTHPDRAGGLGFLGIAQGPFSTIAFAFSTILAATGGQELFLGRASFADYQYILVSYVALILALFLGPLYVFSGKLIALRVKGSLEYGELAQEYVWLFHRKWIKREVGESEAIIGSGDIQSLADLDSSFGIVEGTRIAPVDLMTDVVPLAIATLAPFAPWILLLVPIDELASFLLGIA